jgi:hypothetical protein
MKKILRSLLLLASTPIALGIGCMNTATSETAVSNALQAFINTFLGSVIREFANNISGVT